MVTRKGDAGRTGGYLAPRALSDLGSASTSFFLRTPSRNSTRNPLPVVGSTPRASKRPGLERAAPRSRRVFASNGTPSNLTWT